MAVPYCSLVLSLLSALFHQPTEAVPKTDWNRVVSTFDRSNDSCRDVTSTSGQESRTAADGMCEEAFMALDRLRLNICNDWQDAKCRFIVNEPYAQCTCKITMHNDRYVTIGRVKAFRECAEDFRMREQNSGQAPAPTRNFQEMRSSENIVWNAARSRLASNQPGPEDRAGTSAGGHTLGGVGRSCSVYPTGGAGSFRGVNTKGGAGSTSVARFEDPSTGFPSYAPDASGIRICEPRTGGLDLNNPPEDYVCAQCGGEFMSARDLFIHKILSHSEGNTRCDFCNSPYANRKTLLAHIRKKHTDIADALKAGEPGAAKYPCVDCDKTFKTKNGLRDHAKSHNTMETYCGPCDKILATKQGYKFHLQQRHPEISESEADKARKRYIAENPEACDQCPKRFKNYRGLRDHLPSHDGQTTCDECGAILTSKSTLTTHKRKEHRAPE